jgi:transglutaminase-like putative cysteine protease
VAYLRPRCTPYQRLLRHRLEVVPRPTFTAARSDYFGNPADYLTLLAPQEELVVVARSEVEVAPRPPLPDPESSRPWEKLREPLGYRAGASYGEEVEFLYESPFAPWSAEVQEYVGESFPPGRPLLAALIDLTGRIHREFRFAPEATDLSTPITRVLEERSGVCQDFAHLMIAGLRALGLPARYVSGYLLTEPPPGQLRLAGADASHAWVQAHTPEAGWVDLDPTNGMVVDAEHITLAWGRDYGDVCPLKGVIIGGGAHRLQVAVTVTPLPARTRLTRPGPRPED